MSTTPTPSITTSPVATIVAKKKIANGIWSITLRVNDDATTDSTHTIYALQDKLTQASDVTAWIVARKAKVVSDYVSHQALDDSISSAE